MTNQHDDKVEEVTVRLDGRDRANIRLFRSLWADSLEGSENSIFTPDAIRNTLPDESMITIMVDYAARAYEVATNAASVPPVGVPLLTDNPTE